MPEPRKPILIATYTGHTWIYTVSDGIHTTATYQTVKAARLAWKAGERIPIWDGQESTQEGSDDQTGQ